MKCKEKWFSCRWDQAEQRKRSEPLPSSIQALGRALYTCSTQRCQLTARQLALQNWLFTEEERSSNWLEFTDRPAALVKQITIKEQELEGSTWETNTFQCNLNVYT